jgi:hypothetical protein
MRIGSSVGLFLATMTMTTLAGTPAIAEPSSVNAGTCSVVVPNRVAISTPYRGIPVRLASNCASAGVVYASWDGYHPTQGWEAILIFDESTSDIWDLYDWEDLGRWTWRPGSAWDADYDDVAQNTPYTDIKLASWTALTATRSGTKVTLNVSVARYAYSLDKFVSWAGAVGQIQYRVPGTTTWQPLKSVTASSTGKYTYAYTTSAVREYRVYFPATAYIWNVASPTVRR